MCVYQPLLFLAFVAYGPVLLWRSLWDRRFRRGLRERMGGVPRLETDRGVVWIHGVSVGEVKAARNFIALLRERRPDLQLVISSTTPNGHQVARQEHPDLPVIYYPLDLGPFPGRALRRIRPRCVLLMELEIWPNFLQVAHRRGIPIAIINGRISERTFHGYRLARGLLFDPGAADDVVQQAWLVALTRADGLSGDGRSGDGLSSDGLSGDGRRVDGDRERAVAPRGARGFEVFARPVCLVQDGPRPRNQLDPMHGRFDPSGRALQQ